MTPRGEGISYVIQDIDTVGLNLRCTQTFEDDLGDQIVSELSNRMTIVKDPSLEINFEAVILDDGTPEGNQVGHVLTAVAENITGGTAPVEYEYRWVRAGLVIGESRKTHLLTESDVGYTIRCDITVAEPDGSDPYTKTAYYGRTIIEGGPGVEIKKPEVLSPANGSGSGGDTSYYPETSEIIAGGVEVIENGINPEPYLGATAVYTGNASEAESKNPDGIIEDVPGANWYVSFLQSGGSSGNAKLTYPISIPSTDKVSIEVKTSGFTSSATGKFKLIVNGDNGDKFVEFSDADIFFEQTKTYDINGVQGVKGITLERTGQDLLQTGLSLNNIAVDDVIVGKSYISETKLTFTNDKAFDSADGTEKSTIDQVFKAGDKVVGEGDAKVFADSAAFSTTIYKGIGTPNDKVTGIDNTDKALVWIKCRDKIQGNRLVDTETGPLTYLVSDSTDELRKDAYAQEGITSFNSNGFSTGTFTDDRELGFDRLGFDYVAWNFRAAPGFFDVVTYEGKNDAFGQVQYIPHSLGSTPGMVIIKKTDTTAAWCVWHKDLPDSGDTNSQNYLELNESRVGKTSSSMWPEFFTDKYMTVGQNGYTGYKGGEYVAYLFADTPGLIKCASFDSGADFTAVNVDVGFKPAWLLVKGTKNSDENWNIYDKERGLDADRFTNPVLLANESFTEFNDNRPALTDTGFTYVPANTNETYIYVAIAENAEAGQFMPTGVLTEDADKSGPSMTLTDVTGEWKPGLTAVNQTEVTEHAPCGGDIQFLSSKPETVTGTVTAWGAAEWKLTNTDTNDVQTATVQLQNTDPEQGPTTFTVEDNTQYSVEVSYSSSDPASGPVLSDPSNFQTCQKDEDGWFGKKVPGSGWRSITYGDSKFVAIAKSNRQAMYAEDPADTWTTAATPYANWRQIIYGDDKYVAVAETTTPGLSNYVLYASDPAGPWTEVNTSHPIRSITYGDGKFAAVLQDSNNHVMYANSPAGPWSYATISGNLYWGLITYGDGNFVAVKDDSIAYATDPAGPWSYVSTPINTTWDVNRLRQRYVCSYFL